MSSRPTGFSLLELVLVMVILGLLMSVAAWNLVGQGEQARIDTTQTSMRVIEQSLKAYQTRTGAFPTTEQGINALVPQYLEKTPLDGWKRPFRYYSPGSDGRDFEIISLGKDATEDTPDDVRHWEIQ